MKKVLLGCLGAGSLVLGGALVLLLVIGLFTAGPPRNETAVVTGEFRAQSMDFDRESNAVYLVKQKEDYREPEGEDLLVRHDLSTGKETVVYNAHMNHLEWVSVSMRGTVYLHDGGVKPLHPRRGKKRIVERILEFEGARIVRSIPVLSGEEMFERSGHPKWVDDSIAVGCAAAVAGSTSQTPLGIERIAREAAMPNVTRTFFLPRFLVLASPGQPDVAVRTAFCGPELQHPFRDRFFGQNLSRLNEKVVDDTEREIETTGTGLLVDRQRGFVFRSARKWDPLSFLYNFWCEKHYDEVVWGRFDKVNLGSCSAGVIGFPESYDVFTADGEFIYRRWRGVYRLSRHDRRDSRRGS